MSKIATREAYGKALAELIVMQTFQDLLKQQKLEK